MSEYQAGDSAPAASATTQAQETVREAAQQASRKTTEYVRQQTETRASRASEELRSVADAMRRSAHTLHADGKGTSGSAVDKVAQSLEGLSRYLGQTSGDQMLGDLESFGRRRPWGMIGIGLGLGLAASRLLKASSQRRYEEPMPGQLSPSPAPAAVHAPAEPVTQVGPTGYQGG